MYYGELKKRDIANGRGVRVSLFVSGCTRHCPGCFNSETWNFHYGKPFTEETVQEVIEALAPSYISGLTLLGGEPMESQNQSELIRLVRRVLLSYIDVLVDGEFIQARKNISLQFRGSENQRIICVPESLKTGKTILWKP